MTTMMEGSRSLPVLRCSLLLSLVLLIKSTNTPVEALSSPSPSRLDKKTAPTDQQPVGNVLILDHLNINHQRGRHGWLKAFYFDFLGCSVDPRKAENLEKGSKTLWANLGAHQFHLPEGTPEAQVLQGEVTLAYPNLQGLQSRYKKAQEALDGSKFVISSGKHQSSSMTVLDPWGSKFHLVASGDNYTRDQRGTQPGGDETEGLGMCDLTIYTPQDCNIRGIARFYEEVLHAPIVSDEKNDKQCVVSVGPQQTLTFVASEQTDVSHDDLRQEEHNVPDGKPAFMSNYGPHVSMYVADLASTYKRADELGVAYVNPRFKRRAYTLDEALDQCMFRCIDIVDPQNVEAGPILKLEHEIRSVVKPNGGKYKSCPFDTIPKACVAGKK